MPQNAPFDHAPDAPLLALDGVACERGGRILWRGLNLSLMPGAIIHVTGPNGIGKSSLLRLAAGLLPVFAGQMQRRAAVALIDERHALDSELPLVRALGRWARIVHAPHAAISAAMAATGIAHLAPVPVRLFSTGQRKRAALARLLIANAPLWLVDEPGNGLDADGLALLRSLITRHRARGGAALLASHFDLLLSDVETLDLGPLQP